MHPLPFQASCQGAGSQAILVIGCPASNNSSQSAGRCWKLGMDLGRGQWAPAIWSSNTGSNFFWDLLPYCPSDSRMKVVVLTKMVSMMKAEITSGVDRFRRHLGLGKGQQREEGSLPILAVQPQVHTKNLSFKQYFVCHLRHFEATIQTTNDHSTSGNHQTHATWKRGKTILIKNSLSKKIKKGAILCNIFRFVKRL